MKPYLTPLVLWAAAIAGLVMMLLLDDGVGDLVGLVLLCAPLVILARHVLVREP